jgi:hypothetical protein
MFDSNPTFNYVEVALTPAQIYQAQSGTLQNFLIPDGGTGDQSSYQIRTYKFTMPGGGSTPVRFALSASNPQGLATKYSFSLYDDDHNGNGGSGGDGLLQEAFDTPVAGLPQDIKASKTVTSGNVSLKGGETYFVRLIADGDYLQAGGNGAQAKIDYTFKMEQPPPPSSDRTPPVATLRTALRVRSVGGAFYKFVIRYTDDKAIDLSTIDSADVNVTGPGGFSSATRLLSKTQVDGKTVDAFYRLAARGGKWDRGDNGLYTFNQVSGQVKDSAGNSASATPIGQFTVRISKKAQRAAVAAGIVPALAASPFSSKLISNTDDVPVWA